jgi:hypothetical protein
MKKNTKILLIYLFVWFLIAVSFVLLPKNFAPSLWPLSIKIILEYWIMSSELIHSLCVMAITLQVSLIIADYLYLSKINPNKISKKIPLIIGILPSFILMSFLSSGTLTILSNNIFIPSMKANLDNIFHVKTLLFLILLETMIIRIALGAFVSTVLILLIFRIMNKFLKSKKL